MLCSVIEVYTPLASDDFLETLSESEFEIPSQPSFCYRLLFYHSTTARTSMEYVTNSRGTRTSIIIATRPNQNVQKSWSPKVLSSSTIFAKNFLSQKHSVVFRDYSSITWYFQTHRQKSNRPHRAFGNPCTSKSDSSTGGCFADQKENVKIFSLFSRNQNFTIVRSRWKLTKPAAHELESKETPHLPRLSLSLTIQPGLALITDL